MAVCQRSNQPPGISGRGAEASTLATLAGGAKVIFVARGLAPINTHSVSCLTWENAGDLGARGRLTLQPPASSGGAVG